MLKKRARQSPGKKGQYDDDKSLLRSGSDESSGNKSSVREKRSKIDPSELESSFAEPPSANIQTKQEPDGLPDLGGYGSPIADHGQLPSK